MKRKFFYLFKYSFDSFRLISDWILQWLFFGVELRKKFISQFFFICVFWSWLFSTWSSYWWKLRFSFWRQFKNWISEIIWKLLGNIVVFLGNVGDFTFIIIMKSRNLFNQKKIPYPIINQNVTTKTIQEIPKIIGKKNYKYLP